MLSRRRMRSRQAVLWRNGVNPFLRPLFGRLLSEEIDPRVFGRLDVAGPEEPDLIAKEERFMGNAFKCVLNRPVRKQVITTTAFQFPHRSRGLIEFHSPVVDEPQFHWNFPRLEQLLIDSSRAVMDVFEIQAGIFGYENVLRVIGMPQGGQAVVAGTVTWEFRSIDGMIIGNDHRDRPAFEDNIMLIGFSEFEIWPGKASDFGSDKRILGRERNSMCEHPGEPQ